ncbi:thermonuclease family protein [Sulfitobacter sp. EhC04]|uniref:thermonuclease family protein n=1 Tax=Sulfitobacter sp. EhC04 TaxID=1849168 RepID=UPI000ACD1653|nr:thermonuclease family protein [Sulfitobacter sp. EhC04]
MLMFAGAVQAADVSGVVRVVDGDTLDVGGTRIRIFGIDAPERDQPCTTLSGQNWGCGDWVTRQVRDLYEGRAARCTPLDRDRYGRIVARCFVADEDVGQALVRAGLAYAYRKYSLDYDLDEKAALVSDRGIHGFVLQSPARYRLTRIEGRVAADPNCRIKGNISASGERIYHTPGQAFYDRTGISAARGERWFCSEAQARASGWRPARR